MSPAMWLMLWALATLGAARWMDRRYRKRPPTHRDPDCTGLWLWNVTDRSIECTTCRADAFASPENLRRIAHENQMAGELALLASEGRELIEEPWREAS